MGIRYLALLFLATLSLARHTYGADPGCEGIVREVFPLGHEVRVERVEEINRERAEELLLYTAGADVQSQLKNQHMRGLVGVRDEAIAGSLVYERRNNYLQIRSLSVAKSAERTGVGRDIVEALLAAAHEIPGIEDVRVIVNADDDELLAFFRAVGFDPSEKLPHYFDHGTITGTLLKHRIRGEEQADQPQLQAAPQPQLRKPKLQLATIAISRSELLKRDPTLANAGD